MEPPFPAGTTGLIVPVLEADPVVGPFRDKYDTFAGAGVPAHITALVPWVPEPDLTPATMEALRTLVKTFEPFDASFDDVGRFPHTLWLAPTPAERFQHLTRTIWEAWPTHAPYEGQFDDIIPHLTVADAQPDETLDRVAADIVSTVPIHFHVHEIALYTFDGVLWHERERFPFA